MLLVALSRFVWSKLNFIFLMNEYTCVFMNVNIFCGYFGTFFLGTRANFLWRALGYFAVEIILRFHYFVLGSDVVFNALFIFLFLGVYYRYLIMHLFILFDALSGLISVPIFNNSFSSSISLFVVSYVFFTNLFTLLLVYFIFNPGYQQY